MKPIVFDLFCGLGGWSEAFINEGYRAIGFDIEAHDYGNGSYPGEFVLRDVRAINGIDLVKEFGVPACIVASPPCQEFSYMAMPWSKAKEKMKKILADPAEQKRLTDLFNQCFRIQREVSAACGHYVPMTVENVRGAQRWVGKARWNFGSFYLWGDVPALMPIPAKRPIKQKGSMTPGVERWCGDGVASFPEGEKLPGNNSARKWADRPISRLCDTLKVEGNKTAGMKVSGGKSMNISMAYADLKNQAGTKGYAIRLGESRVSRMYSSKSKQRKQSSAEIAKIPLALASWIAKVFKPSVK